MFDIMKLMATGDSQQQQHVVNHVMSAVHALQRVDDPRARLQMIEWSRRQLTTVEAETVADRYEAGDSDTQVEGLFTQDGKTSRNEAKKRASRGKAVNANPNIATKMRTGSLSTDQADVLADAASDTDGAAACDEELIESIEQSTPEQGRKKTNDWITKRKSNTEAETEHQRHHRLRNVYRTRSRNGLHRLVIEADETSIDQMERKINAGADAEFEADGGRERSSSEHPRTHRQRRFDAVQKIFTTERTGTPARKRPAGIIHVTVTVDQLTGADSTVIRTADGKALPRTVVEELCCRSEFIGHIYSEIGETLWEGRRHRTVTRAQWTALVARDGGCQQCSKSHEHCVAHHIIPWNAPLAGETNIDNLVLLCEACHSRLHAQKLTLVRNIETRNWETRPATAHELPADAPPGRRRRRTKHPASTRSKPRLDQRRKQHLTGALF